MNDGAVMVMDCDCDGICIHVDVVDYTGHSTFLFLSSVIGICIQLPGI